MKIVVVDCSCRIEDPWLKVEFVYVDIRTVVYVVWWKDGSIYID